MESEIIIVLWLRRDRKEILYIMYIPQDKLWPQQITYKGGMLKRKSG